MKRILLSATIILAASLAGAQTVTVNSAGGADHTTINAALAAVVANPATPDVINIVGGGPYIENLVISTSVTIQGSSYRPVIVTTPTSGTASTTLDNRGIAITTLPSNPVDITVHLENMVLIPSTTTAPARAIYSNNNATGLSANIMTIELVDLLVTGNNGSNVPVTTTGLSLGTVAGSTFYGDDLVMFQGIANVTMDGCIVSHALGAAASPDGVIFFPDQDGNTITISDTIISYTGRVGLQIAGDGSRVRINGTASNPVILKSNNVGGAGGSVPTAGGNQLNGALAMFQDTSVSGGAPIAANDYVVSYLVIADSEAAGIATGFADDTDGLAQLTADHIAIVGSQGTGINIADTMLLPWVITDSTVVNNGLRSPGAPAISISTGTALNINAAITLTDCVIAGNGGADSTNGVNTIYINDEPTATVTLNQVATVTSGPYAMSANYLLAGASVAPTVNGGTTADPLFWAISPVTDPKFLDVGAAAYAGIGSASSDLSGYGLYDPFLGANDSWKLYD